LRGVAASEKNPEQRKEGSASEPEKVDCTAKVVKRGETILGVGEDERNQQTEKGGGSLHYRRGGKNDTERGGKWPIMWTKKGFDRGEGGEDFPIPMRGFYSEGEKWSFKDPSKGIVILMGGGGEQKLPNLISNGCKPGKGELEIKANGGRGSPSFWERPDRRTEDTWRRIKEKISNKGEENRKGDQHCTVQQKASNRYRIKREKGKGNWKEKCRGKELVPGFIDSIL